ncbi:MAG: glycosyltransferase family 4 protein [Candidatus Krumholzibacteria bacterium]|nr:glycosyltransferase family 4 protein [Candidatus Krumholzibacteria bacterium]
MTRSVSRKVLMASPLPPPPGGIATWTEIIVKNGLPGGFQPVIVNTTKRNGGRSGLARVVVELFRTARVLGAMVSRTLTAGPALVHVNCSLSPNGIFRDWLCGVIGKVAGKPLVTQYHGDIPDYVARYSSKKSSLRALHSLSKLSNVNITLNAGSLDYVARLSPKRHCVLLPNFIEDSVFDSDRGELRANTPVRGLYVGHLLLSKGFEHIRDVAAVVPEVEFRLLGPDIGKVTDIHPDLPDNVRFLSPVDRSGVFEEMRRSDFLFFPSYSEGFPITVLEAMAVGLPVVATRVGAIPAMVVEGKGGFLAAKDDSDALASAVRKVAENGAMRKEMGAFNRERSKSLYSYSVVVQELAGLYETTLK